MSFALADVKREWRQFRDDEPGERFRNHRERMQKKSKAHAAVSLALGVLLVAAGVAFLFIPGPGIPLILFGVALVAAHSRRLSDGLDRTEPRLRETGHRVATWWRARSHSQKIAMVISMIGAASAGLFAIWKWVVVAYVLA